MTDGGKLTNNYIYDPYGTLTSGMADVVNYYGYNAELTNTKAGNMAVGNMGKLAELLID